MNDIANERLQVAALEEEVAALLREQVDAEERGGGHEDPTGNGIPAEEYRFLGPDDPPVLGHHDPGRMNITREERRKALAIRDAIFNDPELEPVSDFMCAQLAIVEGSNIEAALERVRHLNHFREEYDIKDDIEDGIMCFLGLIQQFPKFHLSFTYHADNGNYVMVYDMACFDLKLLSSEKAVRNWLGGSYYSLTVLCPDLEAVRRGAILINECQGYVKKIVFDLLGSLFLGRTISKRIFDCLKTVIRSYDWKVNMNLKLLQRVWGEVAAVYPCQWHAFKYFNAGTTLNLVFSMLRPVLPQDARNKLEFGCQFEERLDKLYLVPNLAAANDRLTARFLEALRMRYENEKIFRL